MDPDILAFALNDFRVQVGDPAFQRLHLVFVLFLGLLLAAIWPVGRPLEIIPPDGVDLGFTLLFILSAVFASMLLASGPVYFTAEGHRSRMVRGRVIDRVRAVQGQALSLFLQLLLLLVSTLPLAVLIYVSGLLEGGQLLRLYRAAFLAGTGMAWTGAGLHFLGLPRARVAILLGLLAVAYSGALFHTFSVYGAPGVPHPPVGVEAGVFLLGLILACLLPRLRGPE